MGGFPTSCPKGSFIKFKNFSSILSSRESKAPAIFDVMVANMSMSVCVCVYESSERVVLVERLCVFEVCDVCA
jgi:hypothetical protein